MMQLHWNPKKFVEGKLDPKHLHIETLDIFRFLHDKKYTVDCKTFSFSKPEINSIPFYFATCFPLLLCGSTQFLKIFRDALGGFTTSLFSYGKIIVVQFLPIQILNPD